MLLQAPWCGSSDELDRLCSVCHKKPQKGLKLETDMTSRVSEGGRESGSREATGTKRPGVGIDEEMLLLRPEMWQWGASDTQSLKSFRVEGAGRDDGVMLGPRERAGQRGQRRLLRDGTGGARWGWEAAAG